MTAASNKKISRYENKVIAVVVTYNRLDLLKECIKCLLSQSALCDVLIVDNASTDGTHDYLSGLCKKYIDPNNLNFDYEPADQVNEYERLITLERRLLYTTTDMNIGGAGGFNLGMKIAAKIGYEYIWVMDDDSFPFEDALKKLLEADLNLKAKYGWLSSVVLWTDGHISRMNRQKLLSDNGRHRYIADADLDITSAGTKGNKGGAEEKKAETKENMKADTYLLKAVQTTFVSLFIRSSVIDMFGLPIKEFFIWGDDVEFTRRIAVRGKCPGYVVLDSEVIHAMKQNTGSSISGDDIARIERYRLAYRNEAYTYRKEGLRGVCYYMAKCALNCFRIIFKSKDHKRLRLRTLFSGIVDGVGFKPIVEKIDR